MWSSEVAPPTAINIPPLRVWTFIPVTGQIISRQVIVDDISTGSSSHGTPAKSKRKAVPDTPETDGKQDTEAQGSGSAAGKKLPLVPKPKGKIATPNTEDGTQLDDDEEDGDEAEEVEEDGTSIEDELAKLEALQTKTRKKKETAGKEVAKKKPRKA